MLLFLIPLDVHMPRQPEVFDGSDRYSPNPKAYAQACVALHIRGSHCSRGGATALTTAPTATAAATAACAPTRPTPPHAILLQHCTTLRVSKVWPATLSSCADMRMGAASRTSRNTTFGISKDGQKSSRAVRTRTNVTLRC